MNKRSGWVWITSLPILLGLLLLSGCGQSRSTASTTTGSTHAGSTTAGTTADSLPRGVMSAAQACRLVVGRAGRGFFTDPEQVHLVLTSYAKGEPAESQGDISSGMPAQTLVWVVEVHAKAVNWDHSTPAGYHSSGPPDTDFSVVMNAKTGYSSDQGECRCWPLPLSKVGAVVSLPPEC